MGFFSGGISFTRFRVKGKNPNSFSQDHLERLQARAIGKERTANRDGIEAGWTAGGHLLDVRFNLEKNIVNDTLHFAFRLDANKPPADLLRAYTQMEIDAAAAENPSGRPSQRQKRDARMAAMEKLNREASDGRFLKRKAFPLLWDARSNELLVGTTSLSVHERLAFHFEQTFGVKIEPLTAGALAHRLAQPRGQTRAIDDAQPTSFHKAGAGQTPAWIGDEATKDFLGNEFLLWLWHLVENHQDVIPLQDGTEVTLMLARTLSLECPRGQTGKATLSADIPTRLPESKRALQEGKMPRKCGMTLVRQDDAYELSLAAELFSVSSLKLPAMEALEERARLEERVDQIRHFLETLDLLFDAFGKTRCSDTWQKETGKIRKWLKSGEGEE
ncbi:MAG: hypothetical protein EXR99_10165 [Gemmataceae bacterium]|nr:hypothetical protein [Gemmataceae bacterium]